MTLQMPPLPQKEEHARARRWLCNCFLSASACVEPGAPGEALFLILPLVR